MNVYCPCGVIADGLAEYEAHSRTHDRFCPDCRHNVKSHDVPGDTEGMVSCHTCAFRSLICDTRIEVATMSVRTAPRPAGDGWRKVPSVYAGGASHFWHRRTADALEWLTYDRLARSWCRVREPFAGETTREYVSDPGMRQ